MMEIIAEREKTRQGWEDRESKEDKGDRWAAKHD